MKNSCSSPPPADPVQRLVVHLYRLIRRAIKTINAAGQPVIFYLHPWELDPEQPRLTAEIPPLYRMTHYYNLTSTAEKLAALLSEFRFAPLADLQNR